MEFETPAADLTADVSQPPVEATSAVVEPTTPAPAPAATPAPAPAQPAVEPAQEEVRVPQIPVYDPVLHWQQQAQAAYEEATRLRQQRDELELAQVPEEEREMFQIKRELERIKQERETAQQQQAVNEWRSFTAQYVDDQTRIKAMTDPLEMVNYALTNQTTRLQTQAERIKQLEAEVTALKQVQTQPAGGPPVTSGANGTTPMRTQRTMTGKELDEMYERARLGLLKDSEIPPI